MVYDYLFPSQRESHSILNTDFFFVQLYLIYFIQSTIFIIKAKYFEGKMWPCHLSFLSVLFLYDLVQRAWVFERLIFDVEASSHSFKIPCSSVSSVKWSDTGHFLESRYNFFCHLHVPFFYILLTFKIMDESLKSFLGHSILHYYNFCNI